MKKSLKVNSCQVCALINRTAQVFIKIRFSLSLKKDGREGNWASFHLHFPTSDILISTPRKMFCCSCIPPPPRSESQKHRFPPEDKPFGQLLEDQHQLYPLMRLCWVHGTTGSHLSGLASQPPEGHILSSAAHDCLPPKKILLNESIHVPDFVTRRDCASWWPRATCSTSKHEKTPFC